MILTPRLIFDSVRQVSNNLPHLAFASLTLFSAAGVHAAEVINESRAVSELAPEYADWLTSAVQADEFKEPSSSTAVKSLPYADAAKSATTVAGPVFHQPAGTLTGKTVFAMAGHGWTYDSDEMYYYTQRGLANGIVEDMGNADQMHIFAHMTFNAGATVFPFRPVDHQPEERVLNNLSPQVEFYGDWRAGSAPQYFGSPSDETPYAIARASLEESALARYRPYIPKTGYYPVYVWARDGADRCNQTYRIVYTGGAAEISVDWRKAGKTWAWLGTYYFEQGDSGYVDITNKINDPYVAYRPNYVVADAVRFGNGRGDVPRPSGISGYSREDEGDSYWIERSLGVGADRRLFDIGRDGSSTVSSPPKAAAYANRENLGSFLDRILISFHSNAATGKARGAVALFNAKTEQRPTYQESLAEYIGDEINTQMHTDGAKVGEVWQERERNTYSGINFGELRRDYIQNEMCATIVETAFHDNPADAAFLLSPLARYQFAQATFRGILRWYADVAYPNSAFELPPARPAAIMAIGTKEGQLQVKISRGAVGAYEGGEPRTMRVYRSVNGFGFDGGQTFDLTKEDTISVDPLTSKGVTFVRVTLANAAGESFPSQTVAVGLQPDKSASTLLIAQANPLDRSSNPPYFLGAQPGGPYSDSAWTERVRFYYSLTQPTGYAEALALAAAGEAFDGVGTNAAEADQPEWKKYRRVFLAAETQSTEQPFLNTKVMTNLRALLARNGKLCLLGTGLPKNLFDRSGRQKEFLSEVMNIVSAGTVPSSSLVTSADNRFLPTTTTIALGNSARFWAEEEKVQAATLEGRNERTLPLLKYNNGKPAALLARPFYSEGEVITVGFPLSLVPNSDDRTLLMQAFLKQM